MSQDAKGTRPAQATFAGWLIMGGSIVVVIAAWERIAGLTSLETRESLQSVLAEPPFSNTGMSLDDLTTLVRIGSMVAAGAATATAILAFHALQRSTSARLALGILAPVVLVGGFATAGIFAPMVVAGIVMLWLSPSREWFAGRRWRHPAAPSEPNPAQQRIDPDLPDPFVKPEQDTENPGVEHPGVRPPGPTPSSAHPTSAAPVTVSNFGAPPPAPYAAGPTGTRRPAALVWACAIVWSMSAVVSAMMVLLTVVLVLAREKVFAEIERQQPDLDLRGLSHAEVAAGVFAMTGLVLVWSAIAVVLAVLAFRRANWARVALLASTVAVGVASLAMVVASPPILIVVASAGTTAWLLLRPEVVGWFRR